MTLTNEAIRRIKEILQEADSNSFLRVFVQGGGCSGFSYGFSMEESATEDDINYPVEGINLVVDSMSIQYLQGSVIDYKEDLQGARFAISNPNAVTTCGCGSSFSL